MVNNRDLAAGRQAKIFLICGSNFSQRKLAIANIKKRILSSKFKPLNTLTLYSKEIDLKNLSESLLTFSFDKKKLILFKEFPNLRLEAKEFIFSNLKKILTANYLIFETDKDLYQLQKSKKFNGDKFFNFIVKNAFSFRAAPGRRNYSVEDLIASIKKNDLKFSLYVLESLFKADPNNKLLGPQVIGFLVKRFSYLRLDTLSKNIAFGYLWQADRAIKEQGLSPRFTIETLLVKLLAF